jgi:hypothetical protein
MKLVPTEFVFEKYRQAMYYFSACEYLQSELHADKLGTADLETEIKMHLIRLVKLLIHDMENIDSIDRAIDSDLSLTIQNIADNNDKFILDLMNIDDSEWLHLKFNSNSYYLEESNSLQDNDNLLYYMTFHKTLRHVIFVRTAAQELEFKTTAMHHLYISEDDGLGRYKVQTTKDGKILKQHFVPAGYVEGCCNRFMELSDNFKNLQDASDIYSRQTGWCDLHDNAICFINDILYQLKYGLKQEIEKSLEHYVMPLSSSVRNPSNIDDFFNNVVEREKRLRLQNREHTHPNSLIIFKRRNRTTFIIHINIFENDIFYLDEKVRIFISKYDPDYYVMVSEAWMPKNHEIQQQISSNYQYGDIIKLPTHDKTETLIFIGKTKNSIKREPDKSEVYEIIRDEISKIIKLRKFGEGRLDFGMKYHDWV